MWGDFYKRFLKTPFGTTLEVCCCIKMSCLKKGENHWGGLHPSVFLLFLSFFSTFVKIYTESC